MFCKFIINKNNGQNNRIKCKNIRYIIKGNNNTINIDNKVIVKKYPNTIINIQGNNNYVLMEAGTQIQNNFSIKIKGNNNRIKIKENNIIIDNLSIQILENCENARINIDKNNSFWNTKIQTCDINSTINIGSNCMFSYNTSILNCDGHAIFQNGELVNQGQNLIIDDHCWIGYNATIYKNSHLPYGTIVARQALVTSSLKLNNNTAIGGIPAKIIKENVTWSRSTPNEIIMQKLKGDKCE